MSLIARIFGKRTEAPNDAPRVYISADGTKYIKPNEYVKLSKVRQQIKDLPRIAAESQSKAAAQSARREAQEAQEALEETKRRIRSMGLLQRLAVRLAHNLAGA